MTHVDLRSAPTSVGTAATTAYRIVRSQIETMFAFVWLIQRGGVSGGAKTDRDW